MAVDLCCSWPLWIYIVTFFVVICTLSSMVRFYVKLFLLGIHYFIISILTMLISIRSPGSANNMHRAARYLLWTTKIWGIKFPVKGRENIKEGSNYIIMCNHQSSLDMVTMFYIFPPNTRILAKIQLYYTPFLGFAAWLGGAIFVDRQNHNKAINVMNDTVNQINSQKCSVWVFPEGTRSQGNTLLPFKKGGFHLAQQSQVPILPVIFSDYRKVYDIKKRCFSSGTIAITILPEISTKGLEPSDVEELKNKVQSVMCKEYEDMKTN